MISAAVTFILVILFFISGSIFESLRRLLALLLDISLKILNLFGIQISRREPKLYASNKVRNAFKDIKIMKKSKQNTRIKPSINIVALLVLILSVGLVIFNISTDGIISNFLFEYNPIPMIIQDQNNMAMTFTALIFSIISFSISKLLNQWKETAPYRKAKRDIKLRNNILAEMTSKDLLQVVQQKDKDKLQQLKKCEDEEN